MTLASLCLGGLFGLIPVCARHADPTDQRMVFSSDRDGQLQLYSMRVDGSELTRITQLDSDLMNAAISPDGARIACEANDGTSVEIVEIEIVTGQSRRLTTTGRNRDPTWSPDGERIAFVSERDGRPGIFVMQSDGSEVTRLSPAGAFDRAPSWSPDGTKIAFCSVEGGSEHVSIMSADGTNRVRLTREPGESSSPDWSPDGRHVVFSYSRTGRHDSITRIRADGTRRRTLADSSNLRERYMDRNTASWGPVHSPQGDHILFTTIRDGNAEIYLMRTDGTGQRRLTEHRAQDMMPAWIPAR